MLGNERDNRAPLLILLTATLQWGFSFQFTPFGAEKKDFKATNGSECPLGGREEEEDGKQRKGVEKRGGEKSSGRGGEEKKRGWGKKGGEKRRRRKNPT